MLLLPHSRYVSQTVLYSNVIVREEYGALKSRQLVFFSFLLGQKPMMIRNVIFLKLLLLDTSWMIVRFGSTVLQQAESSKSFFDTFLTYVEYI